MKKLQPAYKYVPKRYFVCKFTLEYQLTNLNFSYKKKLYEKKSWKQTHVVLPHFSLVLLKHRVTLGNIKVAICVFVFMYTHSVYKTLWAALFFFSVCSNTAEVTLLVVHVVMIKILKQALRNSLCPHRDHINHYLTVQAVMTLFNSGETKYCLDLVLTGWPWLQYHLTSTVYL